MKKVLSTLAIALAMTSVSSYAKLAEGTVQQQPGSIQQFHDNAMDYLEENGFKKPTTWRVYSEDNPTLQAVLGYLYEQVFRDNTDILILPREEKDPILKGMDDYKLNIYIIYFKLEGYLEDWRREKREYNRLSKEEKAKATKPKQVWERYFIHKVTNNPNEFKERVLAGVRASAIKEVKTWHKEVFRRRMRTLIQIQDRKIRLKDQALKGNINNLKTKLRNDETHTKNWYKPKIKDGSKTKAHLKGRLIELKNEFNAKVDALVTEFRDFRSALLADRRAKADRAKEIVRNDTNRDNLNKLRVHDYLVSRITSYDYDKYRRIAQGYTDEVRGQVEDAGLDINIVDP